ncbi:hypothetical protein [Glycomyces sp. NPDC021274]|uniref:hypothetical protein n=1 Tax=Glycomyces sp. NPDC021274 TaxID=3155120 RepID=UPI0033EC19E1
MTEKEPEPEDEDLRRAVNLIGKEAGAAPRKRISGGLVAGLVLGASLVIFGTFILVTADFGKNERQPFVQSLNEAENIACSEFIAVGEVVSVAPSDVADRIIVTFAVEDPLKPAASPAPVELDVLDPGLSDPQSALQPGDRVLLEVPQREDFPPAVYRGSYLESRVAEIEQYLDEASDTECPPYFQEGGETVEMEGNPNDGA